MSIPEKPQFYQKKDFKTDKLKEMYGTMPSKRDLRRFNRYMNSEQGQKDWLAHEDSESQKYMQSLENRIAASHAKAKDMMSKAKESPVQPQTTTPVKPVNVETPPEAKPVLTQKSNDYLNAEVPGGQIEEVVVTPEKQYYYTDNKGNRYSYADNKLTKLTTDQTKGWESKGLIKNMAEFRNAVDFNNKSVSFGGINWTNPYYLNNVFRTTNNAPDWNQSGEGEGAVVRVKGKDGVYPLRVWNDRSFAIDTKTGKAYEMKEDWFGEVDGRGNDAPLKTYDLYSFFDNFNAADQARIKSQKQGGIMNKINYFQQGGAAPQQDIKAQVTALVQAAMQGDQKATQTVNQIMEAAKAGDQQAAQLAQMIQQVAQQMQGQATSAKWGSKLGYIRSLKFAKGGKTCPACQQGTTLKKEKTFTQPNKKVEEKACGGKTKKRYFGGWL